MTGCLSALLLLATGAAAQSVEVASIRLHTTSVQSIGSSISGPRVTIEAFSLDNLIAYAYDLQSYQVSGVPSWGVGTANPDRYDIKFKAEGESALTRDQARRLVQSLLAERFQLRFHRETKELPVYELVVAKNGSKLKQGAPDAQNMMTMRGGAATEITATNFTMAQLVQQFSHANGVDRPVLDKTGLGGGYDFTLKLVLDRSAQGVDPAAVSIAFEEQLGLKLAPAKAPLEILVVDHAEKPSDN